MVCAIRQVKYSWFLWQKKNRIEKKYNKEDKKKIVQQFQ